MTTRTGFTVALLPGLHDIAPSSFGMSAVSWPKAPQPTNSLLSMTMSSVRDPEVPVRNSTAQRLHPSTLRPVISTMRVPRLT
jgi:hypothetical protein